MKEQLARAGSVAVAALLLAGSCQLLGLDESLSGDGTVRFLEIEGGCWVIESSGETYEPLSLPREFQEDGLRIRFEARTVEDVASVCQVGPIIELVEIEPSS